jgi:hypothetical protein
MDAAHFDQFTKQVSRRLNRRSAVAAGSLGLTAALISQLSPVHAQGATPSVDATPGTTKDIQILFVQSFGSATIVAGPNSTGSFTITLENGTGQTTYFSDRPERMVGILTDEQFLDGRAFDPNDPPNAAIVSLTGDTQNILVVELSDPILDPASGAVTYTARVLEGTPEGIALASLAHLQEDTKISNTLGPTTLFIDQLACSPEGSSCSSNSDCCSGECCIDYEHCSTQTNTCV